MRRRKAVLALFDGKVPPDLVLHGLSRVGFGIPALLDMMGSWVTGRPGRGLTTGISSNPLPMGSRRSLDGQQMCPSQSWIGIGRSRWGISCRSKPGKMLMPTRGSRLDHTIAEQTQKAAGAAFWGRLQHL